MSAKRFHLGWFLNFSPPSWAGPLDGDQGRSWMDGSFLVDAVKKMEQAGLDYAMFEDSLMVPDVFGGSMESDLKYHRYAPKQDPIPLVAMLAAHTSKIGLIATCSTSFTTPFTVARTYATLDHLTHGRVGWNVVTSSEDRAAQNFGIDLHYEHDARYDRADEFVDVVKKLLTSWDDDAIVLDRENGVYADHTKVHVIDHEGDHYKVRGPLNMMPGPQREIPLCQAGGSPRGMDFAARNATTLLAIAPTVADMKEYREEIRARAAKFGRNPDDIKVMFVIIPILAATDEEAQAKAVALGTPTDASIEKALSNISSLTNIDFAQFDLDQPLPADLWTNGHRSTFERFIGDGKRSDATLRELATKGQIDAVSFVGAPDTVARQMEEVMAEVGGDGFLFANYAMTPIEISMITDGLVPALQRRGLTRTEYEYPTLKENLLAF